MGEGGFSGRSGAPGDVGHRSSVATHPKSLLRPPEAGFNWPYHALGTAQAKHRRRGANK
jgi:hypothetical protein